MDQVNRIKWFLDDPGFVSCEAALDDDFSWESDDLEEGIDFDLLVPIQDARQPEKQDKFMMGFIVGYVLAAGTAFIAILLCAR